MAYFPSEQKIREAVHNFSDHNFSHDHITTADFFKMKVLFCKELVPKDQVTLHMESFARLLSLAAPTFADIRLQSRAFFVPMRTIMEGWNEFITDAPYYAANGQQAIAAVPVVSNQTLISLFADSTNGLCTNPSSGNDYDFYYHAVAGSTVINTRCKLTPKGRWFYDILNSLRYKLNWSTSDSTEMSALPLLAFFRIYCDYFSNPQYNYTADIQKLFRGIDRQLSVADLKPLVDKVYRGVFDDDYFVSAWDNPMGINNVPSGPAIFENEFSNTRSVVTTLDANNRVPVLVGTQDGATVSAQQPARITQFILDSLKAMTNYVKRLGVSGTRAVDRMLSEYGVKLDPAQLNRCIYLGSASQPVQVSDVMSTADTDNAPLGAFAGKGISYGDGLNIHYEVPDNRSEFGYLMVVSTIVPRTGYYQGRDRQLFHISPLDFFHGEFDSVGSQAIRKDELYAMYSEGAAYYNATGTGSNAPNGIFGWSPRYAEYKVQLDNCSGDFCVPSLNGDGLMESFHLMRELKSYAGDGYQDMAQHALDFTMGDIQSGRYGYDRIFNNQNNSADHFICVHHFDIKAKRPMCSMSETFEIEGGKEVTMPFNGTKMN